VSRYGPLALLLVSGAVVGGLLGSQRCYHDCLRDYYLLVFGAVWACAFIPVSVWSLGHVSAARLLAWVISVAWLPLAWWATLVLVPWARAIA
jgi:hypothetical protein